MLIRFPTGLAIISIGGIAFSSFAGNYTIILTSQYCWREDSLSAKRHHLHYIFHAVLQPLPQTSTTSLPHFRAEISAKLQQLTPMYQPSNTPRSPPSAHPVRNEGYAVYLCVCLRLGFRTESAGEIVLDLQYDEPSPVLIYMQYATPLAATNAQTASIAKHIHLSMRDFGRIAPINNKRYPRYARTIHNHKYVGPPHP